MEYGVSRAALVPCLADIRLDNHVRLILRVNGKSPVHPPGQS